MAAASLSTSQFWRKHPKLLPQPLALPRWVATPLVVISSVAYANALFLPPAVDQGIADRVIASAKWVIRLLLRVDLD